jgi:glycosyltransferase involved in cell wall biosynthesis
VTTPTISIIVPAFNEERRLPPTLRTLRTGMEVLREHGIASELIVCDNNSTDRTAAIAGAVGAKVVFEAVNQIARARNTGAAAASGDWLLFVDADSHPPAALFAAVARTIATGACLAGGSTLVFDDARRMARVAASAWNAWSRMMRWAAGSFIFCEASVFRTVGGFSQEFYAAEEIELFRRLKRVARTSRKRIVILHADPIRTSGRKAELYGPWELSRFLLRTIVRGGRTLRHAEECFVWYDGRR